MRVGRAGTRLSAVFLDRDGVINRKAPDGEYVTSWAEFEFLPGALEALALLAGAPLAIIIATNQRGIARGRMAEADLEEIHRRMLDEVAAHGGRIDAVYYCPHEHGCACRKPEVGMFEAAAHDFQLELPATAVIGDSPSDMLAGSRIGALTVFVGPEPPDHADHQASDLADAARWLLDGSP